MKTRIKIGEKFYNVEIAEIKENLLKISVEGENYFFSQDEFQKLSLLKNKNFLDLQTNSKDNKPILNGSKEKEIKSPIAGIISNIYVAEGDIIKPGQTLLTLTAMKMENEIVAENAGEIKKIQTKKTQFVQKNDTLIILK